MKHGTLIPRFTGVLVLVISLSLSACDNLTGPGRNDNLETSELSAMVDVLTQELSLSPKQQQDVQKAFFDHETRRHEPGYLWIVAAELQQTLTPEQKQELFERASQMENAGRLFGPVPFLWITGRHGNSYSRYLDSSGRTVWNSPGGPWSAGQSFFEEVLTPEQLEQLEQIRNRYIERLKGLIQEYQDGSLTAEEFRAQWLAIHSEMRETIEKEITLTPEQEEKLSRLRASRRSGHWAGMEEFCEEAFETMVEVLGLSEEEADAIEALLKSQHESRQALFEAYVAGTLDADGLAEALAKLREERYASLEQILEDNPTALEIFRIQEALWLLRPIQSGMGHGHWRYYNPGNGNDHGNGKPGGGAG